MGFDFQKWSWRVSLVQTLKSLVLLLRYRSPPLVALFRLAWTYAHPIGYGKAEYLSIWTMMWYSSTRAALCVNISFWSSSDASSDRTSPILSYLDDQEQIGPGDRQQCATDSHIQFEMGWRSLVGAFFREHNGQCSRTVPMSSEAEMMNNKSLFILIFPATEHRPDRKSYCSYSPPIDPITHLIILLP